MDFPNDERAAQKPATVTIERGGGDFYRGRADAPISDTWLWKLCGAYRLLQREQNGTIMGTGSEGGPSAPTEPQ